MKTKQINQIITIFCMMILLFSNIALAAESAAVSDGKDTSSDGTPQESLNNQGDTSQSVSDSAPQDTSEDGNNVKLSTSLKQSDTSTEKTVSFTTASATSEPSSASAIPAPQNPSMSSEYLNLGEDQYKTDLFTGSATYSYPIDVPPGRNSLQPDITLSYNHQATLGLPTEVGTAWSLNENYIERDINNTVTDTSDDFFRIMLNGVSAKLVFADGTFHTERESFTNIKKVSGGNNEKGEFWIAKTKDGTTYRFGYNSDSEQVSNKAQYVLRWYLDQVEDMHNNIIKYEYSENPNGESGTTYLTAIRYNDDTNVISFNYDYNLASKRLSYNSGQKIEYSGLLTEISVKNNGNLVAKYALGYTKIDQRWFLTKITEYGSDGVSTLPATTFSYNQPAKGWTSSGSLPQDVNLSDIDEGYRLIDINGDGLTDIIRMNNSNNLDYWVNTGNGWSAKSTINNFLDGGFVDKDNNDLGVRFADINGDAKADIIQLLTGDVTKKTVKLNQLTGWVNSTIALPDVFFMSLKHNSQQCTPAACPTGFTDAGVSCSKGICSRTCQILNCTGNGRVVFQDNIKPQWSSSNYQKTSSSNGFTPSSNKCYTFEYTGSTHIDSNDDSECYNLYTNKITIHTSPSSSYSSYDIDCLSNNIHAYAGVGFIANGYSSDSWLASVYGDVYSDGYGFTGNVDNSAWHYRYFSLYDNQFSPDSSGSNAGDWDGLNNVLCYEAGTQKSYCTPSAAACALWGKGNRCGYGCAGQSTSAFATSGIYVDIDGDLYDALNDNVPDTSCGNVVKTNDYYGYGNYTVTEYDTALASYYQQCGYVEYDIKDNGTRIADVNGDGLPDIVQANPWLTKTWVNTGNGFVEDSSWKVPSTATFVDSSYKDTGIRLEDLNGDGLVDIVQANYNTFKTWINNRSGWELDTSRNIPVAFLNSSGQPQGIQLVDVNGDGLVDIIQATSSTKKVWINNGTNWQLDSAYQLPNLDFNQQSSQLSDMNGDGAVDMIKSTSIYTNNAVKPYLLNSIKNDLGGITNIDYAKTTSLDNTGGDGVSDLPSTGWVVKNVTLSDGLSNEHAVSESYVYDYSGGMYDASTKEFRGFAEVNETLSDNTKTTHKFYQDYQKKGLEYENDITNGNNKYLKVENTWIVDDKGGYNVVELSAVQETRYDRNNEIVRTENVYDNYGNVIKINDLGDVSVTGDEEYTDLSYAYNTADWVLNKLATKIIYDPNNNIFRSEAYYYDNLNLGAVSIGDLTKRIDLVSKSLSAVSLFEYYPEGNIKSTIDSDSHETDYTYDSSKTFIQTTTNALGQTTSYSYDPGTGNLLSTKDPNGYEMRKIYDVFGREIKEIRQYDSESSPSLLISYNLDGSAPEEIKMSEKENEGTTSDYYEYIDGLGNMIQTKQSSENGLIARDILYNNNGYIRAESNPYYSSQGYTSPSNAPRTLYAYDSLGRVTSMTNADSKTQRAVYGKTVSLYDELNRQKDFTYDSKYRITQVKEYNNGTYLTTYTYDQNDQVLTIRDSKNNQIAYTYDALGRKIGILDSDLGQWSFSYDAAGNLVQRTDARDIKIDMTYDALNRVLTEGTTTYIYDKDIKGTLSEVRTPQMTTTYSYDERLRPIREIRTINGISFMTQYQYDSKDRVTQMILPDNSTQTYGYSQIGGINSIPGIVNIDYNLAGLPVRKTFKNNLTSTYTYDNNLFRLKAMSTGNVQSKSYEYDAVGNILKITDAIHSKVTSYAYDLLDRLTQAISYKANTLIFNQSYIYDSIGNILNMSDSGGQMSFAYGTRAHAVTGVVDQFHYHPPVISCPQQVSINENETLKLPVNITDIDGDAVTVTYSSPLNATGEWQTNFDDSGNYTITISATDGDFNVSKDISVNVINVNRVPVITSNFAENYYLGSQSKISLNLTAYDLDAGTSLQKNWIVNGVKQGEGSSFVFSSNGSTGIYNVSAQVSDGEATTTKDFKVQVSKVPITTGLDGNTSNVPENEVSSFYPFILEKTGKGKIIFKEPVNLSETVDFVNTVQFQNSYVSLDSSSLESLKNVPAHVVLYNVVTNKNPIIYYSSEFGATKMEKPCPSSICSNITYAGNTLEFDVTHFSTFSLEEHMQKQIDLRDIGDLTFDILPGSSSFDETLAMYNDGLSELDMTIEKTFNPGFDLSVSPEAISLPGGESAPFEIKGNIVPLTKWDTYNAGEILFKDSNFQHTSKIYMQLKKPIDMTNLDITIGDKTSSDVVDGDSLEFMPGNKIVLNFDLNNLYSEDEGLKVESAAVDAQIEDGGNGKSTSKTNINAGESKHQKVSFNLPDDIGNQYYTLDIGLSANVKGVNYKYDEEINLENLNYMAAQNKTLKSIAPKMNESSTISTSKDISLSSEGKFSLASNNSMIWVIVLIADLAIFLIILLFLLWMKKRRHSAISDS